jgi:hypothetical protein
MKLNVCFFNINLGLDHLLHPLLFRDKGRIGFLGNGSVVSFMKIRVKILLDFHAKNKSALVMNFSLWQIFFILYSSS